MFPYAAWVGMTKKRSRIIANIMPAFAVGFVVYALNHPEASFPWNSIAISLGLYFFYLVVMMILFVAPFKKH